jgi:predicted nucleic acid-binding protein
LSRCLLDTSVLVAAEVGRPLDAGRVPKDYVVSVVTLAELEAGVLAAGSTLSRALRLSTLDAVSDVEVLPIDERVAHAWARLRALLAERERRANVNDLWIAATAVAYDYPVVTQDADFDVLNGLSGLRVLRV